MRIRMRLLLDTLIGLALVFGLMPGMGLTAYAAPTETLLTTITATGTEQASYNPENVATVSFSNLPDYGSSYLAIWGWWGYGWKATVAPADGYTITKCVFYDNANHTATDSSSPFEVETTEDDKTPLVNGNVISNSDCKGIKKIEVYGYATPAHTHDFTYSASGGTITATCSAGCPDGYDTTPATLTLSAADATYTGSAYAGASLDTTAWTGAGLTAPTIEYEGRGDTSYTKSTTAPTDAGTYTASITAGEATATADFTISPMALTIDGATATDRAYDKDNTAVSISEVAFMDSSQQAVSLTLGEDNDYTVTGAMTDANAGSGKTVDVTVTLKNANYSLATNTTTTTVNIAKANALNIGDVPVSQLYTLTSVSASVADKMPADAGDLAYAAGTPSPTGSVAVSDFAVSEAGVVTATLSGGSAGDIATLPVTISSTNYADSTANVVITLTAKDDAGVAVEGAPAEALTYGDADFTLTGSVTNAGTGMGTWTWSTSNSEVFQITPDGSTATVKILKAGSATVTAKYESDTTVDTETTAAITVNPKAVSIQAKDQNIFVGGAVPTLEGADFYTVTGLVGEETLTTQPTLAYQSGGEPVSPDSSVAGTYDIVPSGAAASENYAISYANGTLTISDKGTQTITAENVTATYGDTDKSVSASVTNPATGGGAVSYAVKDGSGDYIDVDAITGALNIKKVPADGKAYVVVTAAETAAYAQATKEVAVTINKASAVAATVTANNSTNDGTGKPLVTVTGEATGGTMQYALGTETEATEPYTTSIPTGTEAGTYYVWYRVAGDENHNDTEAQKVTSTIAKPFSDVPADAWFRGVVSRAVGLGLFSGYDNGNFGPNDKVTRGQVAVVLWNMAGHPAPKGTPVDFTDVKSSDYFYDAVRWARSVGIASGYGDTGRFGPNDGVPREQLAAMVANYARAVGGRDTAGSADDYKAMKDADKVSEWAQSSLGWCFKNEILSGTEDGYVNPQANATRAEAAKVLVCLHDLLQA